MAHRDIIVIGGSTGSLQVLQTILRAFPRDFQAAVFIALHTTQDSLGLIPNILNHYTKLPVMYAVHDAPILPSRIYIAPAGQRHMLLDRGKVRLEPGPRENLARPSIDALFRSASYAYRSQVIGVVVSGNLDDGSAGLLAIKNRGGIAIVQDPEEAHAPSMPASAMESTGVDFVLPTERIGPTLVELASTQGTDKLQVIADGERNMAATEQPYSCPECGGVLEETKEGGMLRFRCRVGHQYSPESLLADQTMAVEKALWAAVRSMEEQAEFSDRLADATRKKNQRHLTQRFADKAQASRDNANILRELLRRTADDVLEVPLESRDTQYADRTGTE